MSAQYSAEWVHKAEEDYYPGESATVEEARHAITLMQQVRSFIRAKLGLTPRQQ